MASVAKTQPTDASVDDFLAGVKSQVRRLDGERLLQIFGEETGVNAVMWGPSIVGFGEYELVSPTNSKMRGIWPRVGFSPRATSLSLYGLKDSPKSVLLLPLLGAFTEGAGCVYVKRLEQIDEQVLRSLIRLGWIHHGKVVI